MKKSKLNLKRVELILELRNNLMSSFDLNDEDCAILDELNEHSIVQAIRKRNLEHNQDSELLFRK